MTTYDLDCAKDDMLSVREHCGHGDPTAAVAFVRIVKRLTQGMSVDDFASSPELMAFVFTGIYSLRDWVFNTHYNPRDRESDELFRSFETSLRARLMQCNGGESYVIPENLDGHALWEYFAQELIPVVDAITKCGDAKTDLSFLRCC